MQKPNDNSKACPTALERDTTQVGVTELSLLSWLVAGMIPGVSREPMKKLEPNPDHLLTLLHSWRDGAAKVGHQITHIAVAGVNRLYVATVPSAEIGTPGFAAYSRRLRQSLALAIRSHQAPEPHYFAR